ncbi:MAG: aminotransferase class I/II-fold pyridoxal phosphate-dependent enzyme [Desulfobacterales bacterium]|nr:aminotransferase class I/II-fold pyridoxal phosphate-dependent enzyme [Desulfobacterales bacterium]
MDSIHKRIEDFNRRYGELKAEGLYFYLQPLEAIDGAWVACNGRRMLNFASYSYLGLLGHPWIDRAAREAIERYGTGTHGVRILAGSLPLHTELEQTIARFKKSDDAIVYSSGYATNLTTVSTLVGRNDVVICDKLNHASIVDGCLLSGAQFVRFCHNDMADLERRLQQAGPDKGKLVVVDAVFSMDGDIIDLPQVSRLCRAHNALLMVDEAHSLGILGATGHGIEEHFGLDGVIDIKMGTLSKTIPSVGGYVAGNQALITYLKHVARAFVFSAALPPAQAAAAKASFEVIEEEPNRVRTLRRNVELFLGGLKARGFDTLHSQTPIVPIICGADERAFRMTALCQELGIFVLPVVSPAVPANLARLRTCVTAAHSESDILHALDVFERAGKRVGII